MTLPRRARRQKPAKRRANPSAPPSYTESHWGKGPKDIRKNVPVPDPRDNTKLIGLGVLHSVVYITEKGGDYELVEYEHAFSEDDPPLLAYGDKDGKLYIVAGGYRVTKHGIVD
jgi:hypothetical protein